MDQCILEPRVSSNSFMCVAKTPKSGSIPSVSTSISTSSLPIVMTSAPAVTSVPAINQAWINHSELHAFPQLILTPFSMNVTKAASPSIAPLSPRNMMTSSSVPCLCVSVVPWPCSLCPAMTHCSATAVAAPKLMDTSSRGVPSTVDITPTRTTPLGVKPPRSSVVMSWFPPPVSATVRVVATVTPIVLLLWHYDPKPSRA